jgi:predicted nuclease with TOPRIM domain
MKNKNIIILAGGFAILIIFTLASCQNIKKMELDFNKKKASMIKESLDLKDKLASLEELLNQKTLELARLEENTKPLKDELINLKLESENLKSEYNQLNQKYADLKKEKDAAEEGTKALEEKYQSLSAKATALGKGSSTQSGKPVTLEPIVVSTKTTSQPQIIQPEVIKVSKAGQVISIDKKSSLIVIDLGRRDGLKEGDTCVVFKKDKKIASGQVINARYNLAAVFINKTQYKSIAGDIEEGDKVLIGEAGGG